MTEVVSVPFTFSMQISELLRSARDELSCSPSVALDAEVLLAFVLNVSRTYLETHADSEVSPAHEKKVLPHGIKSNDQERREEKRQEHPYIINRTHKYPRDKIKKDKRKKNDA